MLLNGIRSWEKNLIIGVAETLLLLLIAGYNYIINLSVKKTGYMFTYEVCPGNIQTEVVNVH